MRVIETLAAARQRKTAETGNTMFKSISAIMAAAAVAAAATFLLAPGSSVSAGPMSKTENAKMHACADRAWPYLNCVGTPFGDPKIRLVTTDHLH